MAQTQDKKEIPQRILDYISSWNESNNHKIIMERYGCNSLSKLTAKQLMELWEIAIDDDCDIIDY